MPTETDHTDSKHEDLRSLRIDHSLRDGGGEPPAWSRRVILGGIAVVVLLGLVALAYRALASNAAEVEVARATAESSDVAGSTVLSASGYIVAHHKISVNSKVTGRVAWIGVEKGDKVKEGQVLVRLEDQEFRAQYQQARGVVESAKARLLQSEHGSRPEEIQQADHNLSEARATAMNDKINLDRARDLFAQGVTSKQSLDDASAKYDAAQQRMNSLEQSFQLAKLGPRSEEVQRARGDLQQAEGQMAYAKSQLDATVIRAPVSGTILERTAEKGELVTAQFASGAEGGPRGSVVALADLEDIQVELDIAQDDFAKLSPRQEGIVTLDAFKDRSYKGEIAEMSPEANRQKATVQVKVKVLQPDEFVRPEMNARVTFMNREEAQNKEEAPLYIVPKRSVIERNGEKRVAVIVDGKVQTKPVTVEREVGSDIYISAGLSGNDSIIVSEPEKLRTGDRVEGKK